MATGPSVLLGTVILIRTLLSKSTSLMNLLVAGLPSVVSDASVDGTVSPMPDCTFEGKSITDAVIQIRGLVKRFGALTAVSGVSFDVKRGEIFGILGPNGAGKTTMLECIEGMQKADDGTALVLGLNTMEHPEQVKDRVGVQLQSSAYFERLTLTEILNLFGQMYSRQIEPEKLLNLVELSEKAGSVVKVLSGGQKQRFTLAASLVNGAMRSICSVYWTIGRFLRHKKNRPHSEARSVKSKWV